MTDEEKKALEKKEQEKTALLSNVESKAAEATKKEIEKFKKSLPEYATPDDLKAKYEGLEETINKLGIPELKTSLEQVKGAIEEQSLTLKKLADEAKDIQNVDTDGLIYKNLLEKKDAIKEFKNTPSKNHTVQMQMKASTVISSAVSGDTQAMRISGVGTLQRRQPYIRQLFAPGTIDPNNHSTIRYVDQANRTEGAAAVAEGSAYGQSDIDWIERNIPIEEYGHYIKVSKRMLDSIDFANAQIRNELITGLNLKIDADLLSGDGSTPNLKGIETSATAYAAGSYASTVQDAQLYDLCSVIGAQLMTGASYIGDAVLLNELDATVNMKLQKDGENNYIVPPFVTYTPEGQMTIDGMKAIVNSGVTANTMYAGDFTRGTVFSGNQLEISMGFENDDFTKGLVTIRAVESLCLLIRVVDNGAFRYVSNVTSVLAGLDDTP